MTDRERLVADRDRLIARLEAGDAKCAAAEAAGEDATGLNDFWCDLLEAYQRVEDRLRREATQGRLDGVG